MPSRRRFLASLTELSAACAASAAAAAAGAAGAPSKSAEAHPVPAPPDLELSTVTLEGGKMYGKASPAVVALPRTRRPSDRFPLLVLLPGGEHTMQRREHGCWGWWSDFRLGATEAALRRGSLTDADLGGFASEEQRVALSARLSAHPWRGMAIVTPFVLRRQTQLEPHGAMVTPFLRALVEWARKELPVSADRASTGLGGISASGAWVLWSGPQLADLFGALVAVQPFTDGYEKPITRMIKARTAPQSMRLVTSLGDRLHKPAVALVEALRKDGIAVEHAAYAGPHAPSFAAGVGGVEALLTMSERLVRPAAAAPASTSSAASASAPPSPSSSPPSSPSLPPPPAPKAAPSTAPPVVSASSGSRVALGVAAGAVAAATAGYAWASRRRAASR